MSKKNYQFQISEEMDTLLSDLERAFDTPSRAEVIRRAVRKLHKDTFTDSPVLDPLPKPEED